MKPWLLLLSINGLAAVVVSILQSVTHKYHLIMTRVTWPTAQNYCRVMYTDLATVQSDNDWIRLTNLLTSQQITAPFWIGHYNDIDSWRWSFNEVPLKNSAFKNWGGADPNNFAGRESCGAINPSGLWSDVYCNGLKPFICYSVDSGSGAVVDRFVAVTSPMLTWSEAQAYCREFYTDLATANDSTVNKLLAQLASQGSTSHWIGLYRDTWKWSDGTKMSSPRWSLKQPNNYWKNENCGLHFKLLEDANCTDLYFFVCHTIPPVKEQIMRLQVKFDGSVQENKAQASILEMIKQKLEENGMLENTMVTWRVQPDGSIFHKKRRDEL